MEKEFVLKCFDKETSLYFTRDCDGLKNYLLNLNSFVIVADENTSYLSPFPEKTIVLKSGEENKKWKSIDKILSFALENELARDSYFIALGGGVICDMTSLAASLYMRGARLCLYSTTLLCMVDATLGGKTAIDYNGLKNLVGTFYPADDIIININTLSSLSDREFLSGMGEVVKHALLADTDELYNILINEKERILSRNVDELEKIVKLSLYVKKSYIERDPREEKGIRSALNFGHTFGHALESIPSSSVSHGEAVVWGMKKALTAGLLLGVTNEEFYLYAINLISSYPFSANEKVRKSDYMAFLDATKKDKKKKGGKTRFVLLSELGKPVLETLTDEQVLALLV